MPYIKKEDRAILDPKIDSLASKMSDDFNPGWFNYVVTRLILKMAVDPSKLTYKHIALITGVLENIKQEFYRRVAAPYEDAKIAENGDVF